MIDKLKNLIERLKKEEMTRTEKVSVYSSVYSKINTTLEPKPSPYFSKFSFVYVSKMAGVLLLVMTIGTASLSYASASALPGDWLYKVKTDLKEKIEDKLTFSSEKRMALSFQRMEIRVSEATTLIKVKKITSEKLSIIEAKIQEDKEKIGNAIEEINKDNPEAVTIAKTDLEASIQESGEKINILIEENNIVDITGEEIHYGEIDLEADGIILPILKEETPPASTDATTTTPVSDGSIIQDLKVVPDSVDVPLPLEEIDGIDSDTNEAN